MKTDRDYDVGYGKPPKQHQFKPGATGNPKGRPKRAKTLQGAIELEARKLINVKQAGQFVKMTKHDALISNIFSMALNKDIHAIKLILTHLTSAELSNVAASAAESGDDPLNEEVVKRVLGRFARVIDAEIPDD